MEEKEEVRLNIRKSVASRLRKQAHIWGSSIHPIGDRALDLGLQLIEGKIEIKSTEE